MYLKTPKASTDPRLRSLLQKAVRRGANPVVEAAVTNIIALGDITWLRSRAVVITFEESWPLARDFAITRDPQSKRTALIRVSRATKQKDAAGMGALAFALHEGDDSMLDLAPSERLLRIVSRGLDRPQAFFDWVLSQCYYDDSRRVVAIARQYLAAATWGWDKATILAGALLASSGQVPSMSASAPASPDFPYWVALDKHTPEGKSAIRQVGSNLGIAYRKLIWASFYCESATLNSSESSPWFEAERSWRLRKVELNSDSAMDLWNRVRPALRTELAAQAESLRAQVELASDSQEPLLSSAQQHRFG